METHYMTTENRRKLLKLLSELDDQYNPYVEEDKEVKTAIRTLLEEVRYNVEDIEL